MTDVNNKLSSFVLISFLFTFEFSIIISANSTTVIDSSQTVILAKWSTHRTEKCNNTLDVRCRRNHICPAHFPDITYTLSPISATRQWTAYIDHIATFLMHFILHKIRLQSDRCQIEMTISSIAICDILAQVRINRQGANAMRLKL